MSPRTPWKAATVASAQAHSDAVTKAVAEKRFEKGVQKATEQDWSSAAAGKGSQRFAGGVADAVGDYSSGTAKFTQVIETTTLPPRGPKGDPRNFERSKVMGMALHKAKNS